MINNRWELINDKIIILNWIEPQVSYNCYRRFRNILLLANNVGGKAQAQTQQESSLGRVKTAGDIKNPRHVQENRLAQNPIRQKLRLRQRRIRQQRLTQIPIINPNRPQPLNRQAQPISQRPQKDQSRATQLPNWAIASRLPLARRHRRRRRVTKQKKTRRVQEEKSQPLQWVPNDTTNEKSPMVGLRRLNGRVIAKAATFARDILLITCDFFFNFYINSNNFTSNQLNQIQKYAQFIHIVTFAFCLSPPVIYPLVLNCRQNQPVILLLLVSPLLHLQNRLPLIVCVDVLLLVLSFLYLTLSLFLLLPLWLQTNFHRRNQKTLALCLL